MEFTWEKILKSTPEARRHEENSKACNRMYLCRDCDLTSHLEATMSIRPVKKVIKSKPTMEGAGVHLRRAFGFGNTSDYDPFLLLDDFRNEVPEDYLAGFPWHPHRGIETITYVLAGTVEHVGQHGQSRRDCGRRCAMDDGRQRHHPPGNAQGRSHGTHARLPALGQSAFSAWQMTPPRYQEVKSEEIPQITDDDGTHVRLVCGSFWGKKGPVEGIAADPVYIDVSVAPGRRKTFAGGAHAACICLCFWRIRKVLQCVRTTHSAHGERAVARHRAARECRKSFAHSF